MNTRASLSRRTFEDLAQPAQGSTTSRNSHRRLSAEERKRAILEAGLPLFAHQGLRDLSTRELAKCAGVSEALLFKYFPSRPILYEEIYRFCSRRLPLEAVDFAALKPSTASLVCLVYLTCRVVLVANTLEVKAVMRMMGDSLLDDGGFARLLLGNNVISAFRERVVACIEAGIKARHIVAAGPPPPLRFWFARNAATQVYFQLLPQPPAVDYGEDLLEVVRQATYFGLRGIGLKEAQIARHASRARLLSWETAEGFRLIL